MLLERSVGAAAMRRPITRYERRQVVAVRGRGGGRHDECEREGPAQRLWWAGTSATGP